MIAAGLKAGIELSDTRLEPGQFAALRDEVLALWPTGRDAEDFESNLGFFATIPRHKLFPVMLANRRQENQIAVVPAVGHATAEQVVEDIRAVERAGADSFFVQCDAYTRKLKLNEAADGITESLRLGKSVLNGFPFVNHGVDASRALIKSVDLPLFVNGDNDEDGRLLSEVALAAGFSNVILCGIRDSLTHEKNYPADLRIRNAQYICRLAGMYTERGIPIEVTNAGALIACIGGTPGMGVAISVLESISAAAQGVKHLTLYHDLYGAFLQDIAAIRVHRALVTRYLREQGYGDVVVSLSVTPSTAAFPRNEWAAASLISWQAGVAALAGIDWMVTKTPVEAFGIPTKESNSASVMIAKYSFDLLGQQRIPLGAEYEEEAQMLEAEAAAIVDACLDAGEGDAAVGRVRGLEFGLIDAPYPSYDFARRAVLTARDAGKAVRWLHTGSVPVPPDVVAFNNRQLADRRGTSGFNEVDAMITDIFALAAIPSRHAPS